MVFAPAGAHTLQGHPENEQRLATLLPALDKAGALANLRQIKPVEATRAQMRRVHTSRHLDRIQGIGLRGGGRVDPDTYMTDESYELALAAAGSCCAVVDEVMTGRARNGLAIVRPPGHHAGADRAEGFCLFNNVAVAARQAQVVHGAERVLILDFDVHHGNGTQSIFYEDESVLFVSLHLFASFFYPGIGSKQEVGLGSGRGHTLNIPFPPYVGDTGYLQALEELVLPKVVAFKPSVMLVSAGFDAHWQDPLAMAGLSLTGYAQLCRQLVAMADSVCEGRVAFVLEGGYFVEALHKGLINLAFALTGQDRILDPLGVMPQLEQDVTKLLSQLKRLHLLS